MRRPTKLEIGQLYWDHEKNHSSEESFDVNRQVLYLITHYEQVGGVTLFDATKMLWVGNEYWPCSLTKSFIDLDFDSMKFVGEIGQIKHFLPSPPTPTERESGLVLALCSIRNVCKPESKDVLAICQQIANTAIERFMNSKD